MGASATGTWGQSVVARKRRSAGRSSPPADWPPTTLTPVVGEPLTNAAVERIRAGIASANVMDRDEFTGDALTDDFVFEDRRSGFNYGRHDATTYREVSRSVFDVGSGRPIWSIPEVIAVRGQRVAATALVIDYGNEAYTDMIACVRFDPQLRRLQRRVLFDIDARVAAIAELDRMHAEIDD